MNSHLFHKSRIIVKMDIHLSQKKNEGFEIRLIILISFLPVFWHFSRLRGYHEVRGEEGVRLKGMAEPEIARNVKAS